ncbi:MAG: GAF domain-containing protein [Ignavibacteria bacterium]
MDPKNQNKTENTSPFEKVDAESGDYHSVLLELRQLDKTGLHDFLKKVLDVIANALNIERVSIWFYSEDTTSIYCDYLYLKTYGRYINDNPIFLKDSPSYFRAIESQPYVAANDAVNDPQTKELSDVYLKPRGIYSMMDVPIVFGGKIIGIICHEELDHYRLWKSEEIEFTTAISSLVSTSLEIDFRKKNEKDFNESQRFLSTLISNLPGYVYRVSKEGDAWTIQYISEGVYDLTGYRANELVRNKVLYYSTMVNESQKQLARKVVEKALEDKKPYQINYRISTAGGKIKWVWEQGRGVFSDDGELIATEGFITDITEKKLFEEETVKKNKELSALYHFGKSLSKLAETAEIIESIGNMLGELFNSNSIYVSIFDEEKEFISFPFYLREGVRSELPGRQLSNRFVEYIISTGKPLLINNNAKGFLESKGMLTDQIEALSMISSPLIAGEKVLGVIALQDYENENSFTDNQLELLATVASQAAIALENAYLYSRVTKSLREKEVLLQEVHHRVKNNLQVMSSLIKLQSHYIKDEKMLEMMKETGSRIQSMAIVHTKLYNTKDYDHIDFSEYVRSLAENFATSYGFRMKNIKINIDIMNILLNIDTAIPCGLVINELVSNSVKYAFPDNRSGEIFISLSKLDNRKFILTVRDTGIGAPQNKDIGKSDTLGIQLVTLLSKQMNGHLQIINEKGKGLEFRITFEEAIYKARS